jgi:PTH2 family peptidyl-tRNA hydrolase
MEYKQAIIVRTDLGMGRGKIAVQACHASVLSALQMHKKDSSVFDGWMNTGMKKIVLRVGSKQELMELKKLAGTKKLTVVVINDAGLTQLAPGTTTAISIGPDEESKIDSVVKELKLL